MIEFLYEMMFIVFYIFAFFLIVLVGFLIFMMITELVLKSIADKREKELRKIIELKEEQIKDKEYEVWFYKTLYLELGNRYNKGGTRMVYSKTAYRELTAWLEEQARNKELEKDK